MFKRGAISTYEVATSMHHAGPSRKGWKVRVVIVMMARGFINDVIKVVPLISSECYSWKPCGFSQGVRWRLDRAYNEAWISVTLETNSIIWYIINVIKTTFLHIRMAVCMMLFREIIMIELDCSESSQSG